MNNIFYGIAVMVTIAGSSAYAQVTTCELTDWKGARDQEITIAWTGTSYTVDAKTNTINSVNGPQATKAKRTQKFTTYKFTTNTTSEGSPAGVRTTYSYRIYNTGKCTIRVERAGFWPMDASGRVN